MPSWLTSTTRCIPRYLAAGSLAGVAIGGAEALAFNVSGHSLNDRAILWWAPIFYALLFAPLGAICGIGCHILLDLRRSRRTPELAYRVAFGVALLAGTITALRWRLHSDHAWLATEYGRRVVDVGVLGAALAFGVVGFWVARKMALRRQWAFAGLFVLACAAASFLPVENSRMLAPPQTPRRVVRTSS